MITKTILHFLISLTALLAIKNLNAQCGPNMTLFPEAPHVSIPYAGIQVISNSSWAGDYFIVEELQLGNSYQFISSNNGDYFTIRDKYDPTVLLDHGSTPFTYQASVGGPDQISVHLNLGAACAIEQVPRIISMDCTSCENAPAYSAHLQVEGAIQLGQDDLPPQAGMIRFNSINNHFEGFNGTKWVCLSQEGIDVDKSWGIPNGPVSERSQQVAADGQSEDYFGYSIDISDDYAIIGAPYHDTNGNLNQGKAYVFQKTGLTWQLHSTLNASDGQQEDGFGFCVSISGDFAVVGAPSHPTNGNLNQGKAYVFHRIGENWVEQSFITASDGTSQDLFGYAVGISNDHVIVGAPFHDTNGKIDQGKAYVYERSGSTWIEQEMLEASDGLASDRFANTIEISDTLIIIGAPFHNTAGNNIQGKAYIFKKSAASWNEEAILTSSDGDAEDLFGLSVGISGNFAVVGAPSHDTNNNDNQGKAYVFNHTGVSWVEEAILTSFDGNVGDNFGGCVGIAQEYIFIGAPFHDINGNSKLGQGYIFERSNDLWVQKEILKSSDGAPNEQFARVVGISVDNIIVGAPFLSVNGNINQGKVYFFH